jgi:hypothetical protein
VWAYLESQVENALVDLPPWLTQWIADMGLDLALDFTYYVSKDYTPDHFYQELQGLADGNSFVQCECCLLMLSLQLAELITILWFAFTWWRD